MCVCGSGTTAAVSTIFKSIDLEVSANVPACVCVRVFSSASASPHWSFGDELKQVVTHK